MHTAHTALFHLYTCIHSYTCFFPQTPNIFLAFTHTRKCLVTLTFLPLQTVSCTANSSHTSFFLTYTHFHNFAQIHVHSLTHFPIYVSLLISPHIHIDTQSLSFPALVQTASTYDHIHHNGPRKMPQSGIG